MLQSATVSGSPLDAFVPPLAPVVLLLFLGSGFVIFCGAIGAAIAAAARRAGSPGSWPPGALSSVWVYGVILLAASLVSRERTLSAGEKQVLLRDGLPPRLLRRVVVVARAVADDRHGENLVRSPHDRFLSRRRAAVSQPARRVSGRRRRPPVSALGLARLTGHGSAFPGASARRVLPHDVRLRVGADRAAPPLPRRSARTRGPDRQPREQPVPRADVLRAAAEPVLRGRAPAVAPWRARERTRPCAGTSGTPSRRTRSARIGTGSARRRSCAERGDGDTARLLADDLWAMLPGLVTRAGGDARALSPQRGRLLREPGPGGGSLARPRLLRCRPSTTSPRTRDGLACSRAPQLRDRALEPGRLARRSCASRSRSSTRALAWRTERAGDRARRLAPQPGPRPAAARGARSGERSRAPRGQRHRPARGARDSERHNLAEGRERSKSQLEETLARLGVGSA